MTSRLLLHIFIGLERRRFALPQKFVSLHSIDLEAAAAAAAANTGSLPGVVVSGACGGGRGQAKQSSIGFFYPPQLQEGKFTTITHTYKLVTVGVVINLIQHFISSSGRWRFSTGVFVFFLNLISVILGCFFYSMYQ